MVSVTPRRRKLIFNVNFVHTNFFGTGNRVAADVNTGQFRTIYSMSHTNPYSTINGVSRTISASYSDITQFTSDASELDTQNLSLRLEYSYPLSEYQSLILGIAWNGSELLASRGSTLQAQEWVANNGDPYIVGNVGGTDFNTFDLIAGWVYDTPQPVAVRQPRLPPAVVAERHHPRQRHRVLHRDL